MACLDVGPSWLVPCEAPDISELTTLVFKLIIQFQDEYITQLITSIKSRLDSFNR